MLFIILFATITHDSKTDPVWYEKHNDFLGETPIFK